MSALVHARDVAIQVKSLLSERVDSLQNDNQRLRQALSAGENQIASLNASSLEDSRIIQSLKDDAKTYHDKIANNQSQIDALNKELKKQKRKTVAAAVGGVAVAGVLIYLYITK